MYVSSVADRVLEKAFDMLNSSVQINKSSRAALTNKAVGLEVASASVPASSKAAENARDKVIEKANDVLSKASLSKSERGSLSDQVVALQLSAAEFKGKINQANQELIDYLV